MSTVQTPNSISRRHYTITAGQHQISLGESTQVMGIINVTPDSFSHDGCLTDSNGYVQKAIRLARKQIKDGANLLDVGGESSRPGASKVSAKEEANRVIPVIQALVQNTYIPISIDTYKTSVAKQALDAGASIVNNIKGSQPDLGLLKMIRNYNAAIVLMHMQGTPKSMQRNIQYDDVISEIVGELRKSIEICLEIGIKSDRIIVDPGIGFGKTVEHNLEILHELKSFDILNKPLLIGTSRKSFIGHVLNRDVEDRLIGTAASVSASILNGAHIIRVHDVKQMKETAQMTDAILNKSYTIRK